MPQKHMPKNCEQCGREFTATATRRRFCGDECQNAAESVRRTVHGQTESPVYQSWKSMVTRCTNPKVKCYGRYGGRGIKVCDRWLHSFEAFFADMGSRPPGHTLDRIDVNGDYEPGNCRWSDHRTQCRNTRANRNLTINGETKCVTDWARDPRCTVTLSTVNYRLARGWATDRAIFSPASPSRRPKPATAA